MRLITRKLWRAFPELDRFDDATCRRFVAAASGGTWRRTLVVLVCLGVGAGVVGLGMFFGLNFGRGANVLRGGTGAAFVIGAVFGPVAAYVARDVLLRFRLRKVLRVRGVCRGCGYSLVGLSVPDTLLVLCPECGATSKVHASFLELRGGEEGERRIDLETELDFDRRQRAWLSEAARRRLRTISRRVAIGVAIAATLWTLGYESFVRWQAERARSGKVALSQFEKLGATMQPAGLAEGATSTWDVLRLATGRMEGLNQLVIMQLAGTGRLKQTGLQQTLQLDFSTLLVEPYRGADGSIDVVALEYARQSQMTYDEYLRGGIDDELRTLAQTRGSRYDVASVVVSPSSHITWDLVSPAMDLSMYARVRMRECRLLQDREGWLVAFEGSLAISRTLYAGCTIATTRRAAFLEVRTLDELSALLARHPDRETLDMIEAAMAGQRPPCDEFAYAIAWERLRGEHFAAMVFEEVDNLRWGRYSGFARMRLGLGYKVVSMGTYAGTRRVLRESWDRVEAKLRQSPAQRTLWATARLTDTGYEAAEATVVGAILNGSGACLAFLEVSREVQAAREATRVQIALERYWHDHGKSYPACLEELVPRYLEAVPVDDWDPRGGAMRYRVIDPRRDEQGRGYLLYSVAQDGIDHGGTSLVGLHLALLSMAGAAPYLVDHVWNDALRR